MSIINLSTDKWDQRWIVMARMVATWSKDPRTKVGAVAVRERKLLVTGYNGFPQRTSDKPTVYEDRPKKLRRVVHAEANCVAVAADHGISLRDSTIYSTFPICCQCAGLLIQAGVYRVAIPEVNSYDPVQHEYLGWDESRDMFSEAGVILITVDA